MKFIHIADVHLGAKPDAGRSWAEERKNHGWQALVQVITKAEEEQADLLLIAGDLFHRQPLLRELKEVNYQFSRLSHTQVVLIAGNHDFISPNSYYRTFQWESNVHFLKERDTGISGVSNVKNQSIWSELLEERDSGDIV